MSYVSSKKRKEFLVLACGQASTYASLSEGKNEDENQLSDDESDNEDEENQTVSLATSNVFDSGISNWQNECF